MSGHQATWNHASRLVDYYTGRDLDQLESDYVREHGENAMGESMSIPIENAIAQRDRLRAALVGLVGVDGREELEAMEAMMRLLPAPAADKAVTIDAIHALIATLPPAR